MLLSRIPLWATSLLYMGCYVPYIVLTRLLATTPDAQLERPLSGLEILPATLMLSGVMTYLFVWLAGWYKSAHQLRVFGVRIPAPTLWTTLSGLGTALILFTVPLSFTFQGVSIPFMQLLMRGDLLIIAPLVDVLGRRKVRWYSWVALLLVAFGMLATVSERRGFNLPALAWVTLLLYTFGYFVRLWVMTRVAKTGEIGAVKGYFVEEKIVGIPLAVFFLGLLSWFGVGRTGDQLDFGFVGVWTSSQLGAIGVLAVLLFVVSIFSAFILLDKRENSFCVPMERSASILAGVLGAYVLSVAFGHKAPTSSEVLGASLLVLAIAVLAIGPHLGKPRAPATAST